MHSLKARQAIREKRLEEWAKECMDEEVEHGEEVFRLLSHITKIPQFEATMLKYDFKQEVKVCAYLEKYNEDLINVGLEKGREEGRAEGRKEGRAEGRAEGRKEGRAEGREQQSIEIVRNMLQEKCSVNFISKMTHVSCAEIERIAKEM